MAHTTARSQSTYRQAGYAALIVILIIGVAAIALFVASLSAASLHNEHDRQTAAALAQAAQALIARAATDNNIPGSLPCPDLDNDGQLTSAGEQFGNCASNIGRLPWKTLGLPDLRDADGERLWYALSPDFQDNASSSPLNSDTPGQFTVTGIAPANNVIAIVFAPGAALGNQVRDTVHQNDVTNYLEGANAGGSANTSFVSGLATATFNDQLILITSDALFPTVTMRVAREARAALAGYFAANGYYPFANSYGDNTYSCTPALNSGRLPNPGVLANFAISATCPGRVDWPVAARPPAWFAINNWHLLTYYAVAPNCTDPAFPNCTGSGGLLTVQGTAVPNDNKQAIVMVSGRMLSGQVRPCGQASDCFEDAENTNGDGVFVQPALTPANNDRLTIVAP